jgi:pantothenate synthetase
MPETQTDKGGVILHWLATLLESNQPDVRLECLAVVDTETFEAVEEIAERALVIVAVWIEGQLLTDGRIIARR